MCQQTSPGLWSCCWLRHHSTCHGKGRPGLANGEKMEQLGHCCGVFEDHGTGRMPVVLAMSSALHQPLPQHQSLPICATMCSCLLQWFLWPGLPAGYLRLVVHMYDIEWWYVCWWFPKRQSLPQDVIDDEWFIIFRSLMCLHTEFLGLGMNFVRLIE